MTKSTKTKTVTPANVLITSALFRGTEIKGTFPLVKKYWADKAAKRNGRMAIELDGKKANVTLFKKDFEYIVEESSITDNNMVKLIDTAVDKVFDEEIKKLTLVAEKPEEKKEVVIVKEVEKKKTKLTIKEAKEKCQMTRQHMALYTYEDVIKFVKDNADELLQQNRITQSNHGKLIDYSKQFADSKTH